MSRPKPNILLSLTDNRYKAEQVLQADAIYAVYYKDKPINLRSIHTLLNDQGTKYKKVSFSNSGHAFNLAERLNKLYKTNQFSVYRLVEGVMITENDQQVS